MLPKNLFPKIRGYTLIELLIVLAIIGILASIILGSYSNFGAKQEVGNAAVELKTNLRKYQTFAMASQKNPLESSSPPCATSAIDYYSFVIDTPVPPSSQESYHAKLSCGSSTTVVLPSVDLPSSISTFEVRDPVGAVVCSSYLIEFLPLNNVVTLKCNGNDKSELLVHLENDKAAYDVHVTSSGDIYETH